MPKTMPYCPKGRTVKYVSSDNAFMVAAKEFSLKHSLDPTHRTGAVVVLDGEIVGRGANGSVYHEEHGCERKRLKIPTGEGYDLCEGCHPRNHAEPSAIRDAVENGFKTEGADLYLWGHWWCCKDCWGAMIDGGVRDVFLEEE